MASSNGAPSPSAVKVLFKKYELGRLLGRGATAKVYHARNLLSGQSVAIKCIRKPHATPTAIEREVAVMRNLRHPHILRLIEVLASRTKIFFILELAKGGELFNLLEKAGHFAESLARKYFQQPVSAIHYCHSYGVFHRDLKPENLLLDEAGNLLVSDFGLSSNAASDTLLHTLCGTPAYVAPEILARKGYSGAEVDVWSCGIILFVLTAGYLPFNDTNLMAMYRKICRGHYRCPRWMSPELRRLISRLLDTNPATRITVEEISQDAWFCRGLDMKKWKSMRKGYDDEVVKVTNEETEREMHAFDLISYSSGLDLSRLFGDEEKERFVVAIVEEDVVERMKDIEGAVVSRVGAGVVVEETGTGKVVARVGVRRLTEEMVVAEVEGGEVWRERLRTILNSGVNGIGSGGGANF